MCLISGSSVLLNVLGYHVCCIVVFNLYLCVFVFFCCINIVSFKMHVYSLDV